MPGILRREKESSVRFRQQEESSNKELYDIEKREKIGEKTEMRVSIQKRITTK